jgi:hypothetical protein
MVSGISKLTWALVAVLWAATLSQAQQPKTQAPQTAAITGTVLDATGSTVPKATIVLQGPAPNDHRSLVTGDDGFFKFDGINSGTPVRIVVSASGFTNWTSNEIILQPGQSFIATGIMLTVATVQQSVNAVTLEQLATEQVKVQEQQRILGVIPNFYVTYEHNAGRSPRN